MLKITNTLETFRDKVNSIKWMTKVVNSDFQLKLSKGLEEELRKAASRPSWESQNEGVHERVNFDDTIWGFNLAGGAYYDTPLRVTVV